MTTRIRDLTRDWRPEDGGRLAQFFNKTGRGWPGGGWDPQTPEEAARGVRERNLLGAFVAEERGRIISFCSLYAKPNEVNASYVGLLTADPDYHGRGYGKAVLLAAIERVHERSIARVDLHTWPGNLKAVPLYKKSGFMWSPESGPWGVLMQNFTPAARRNPIAQEFFRRHNWYRTMKRGLSLAPDEHKRGKVRVYEYHWEEGGERLRMVYDRQSWGLIEVETDDFLAGCSLEDEKLVAGMPQRITWRIANHAPRPLEVVLIASADPGVRLDRRELLRVRRQVELDAPFELDPEIEEKEKEPRAAIIRTDLVINGKPVRLEAGFQAKQAVEFSLDGDGQGLRPGRAEPVVIQCRSQLSKPARLKVALAPSPGVELSAVKSGVRLPAKGSAELPVQLTAAQAGALSLKLRSKVEVAGRLVHPKEAEIHARALHAGDVVGNVEKDRVVLESSALRVTIWRRGGWTSVTDKLRNRHGIANVAPPQLGPPYSWDEFFDTPCEARVEQQPGRAAAVLSTASIYRPGVVLEHGVALSNLPLIEVNCALVNNTSSRLDCSVRNAAYFNTHGGRVATVTGGEIVRGPTSGAGRSLAEHRLPDRGEEWAEGWFAAEDRDGVTAALLWDKAEQVEWGEIVRRLPTAGPGQAVAARPIHLFVGEGGHFTVRRWWQMLYGERADREQRPDAGRKPLRFGLVPTPTVIHGRRAEAALQISSVGRLELGGRLEVSPPEGLRVRPSRLDFTRVNQRRRERAPVVLSRSADTPEGAYFVECTARIDRAIYRLRQPVVVLGHPRHGVRVQPGGDKSDLWRIENGALTMTIAPEFQGSAISLRARGRELIRSAYPEARPLGWQNPWVGGIQARLGGMSAEELSKQRFRAREIWRKGAQGIVWRGVRVSCSPKEGPRRGDRLALDYLLAPGSAVWAVAVKVAHRSATAGWLEAGFELYPVLGGSYLDAILTGSADPVTSRIRCEFGGDIGGDRWVVAENPSAGEAVLMACAGGEASVGGHVLGEDGYALTAWRAATHEARQTRESVFFIAYTSADRVRGLAEALSELEGLP